MTIVPITLSYLNPPPLRSGSRAHDLLDRILAGLARLSSRRPKTVVAVSAAALLVSLWGVLHMHFETDFLRRLPPDNRVRVDHRYVLENFHGTNTLEVFVTPRSREDLHDPELLARIMAFEDEIRGLKPVDGVFSVLDVIALLHVTLTGSELSTVSAQGFERYLALMKGFSGKDLRRAVDLDTGTLRLALRLNVSGFVEINEAAQAVEALAGEVIGNSADVEVTGLARLAGWWLERILDRQRTGLYLTIVLIASMMVVGFRSMRAGLVSMIPNVLPLVAIAGYVGLAWDQIDSDTLIIGMMAIGIGVDDTIHFLMRYRIESGRTGDASLALERTFAFAGRAMVMTTVILVAGFLPCALSDYSSFKMFGTLLPAVLVVALAADLLTVPAMVKLGWIGFAAKEKEQDLIRQGAAVERGGERSMPADAA